MEPIEYQRMFELEDTHWWFQSRLLMLEGMLQSEVFPRLGERPRLLDIGCGTGMFLQRRQGDCDAVGADFMRAALAFSAGRGAGPSVQADATRLPFADGAFDLLTAFDLIEHVSDDKRLVAEAWRVLRPGGMMMATVPAHPLMWSGHDVSLHHQRRYRRPEFTALFGAQGWEDVRTSFCFALIFPPALTVRVLRRALAPRADARSDTRPTAGWLNRLMLALHRPEARWLRRHNLPWGVSLVTIRRKPG